MSIEGAEKSEPFSNYLTEAELIQIRDKALPEGSVAKPEQLEVLGKYIDDMIDDEEVVAGEEGVKELLAGDDSEAREQFMNFLVGTANKVLIERTKTVD